MAPKLTPTFNDLAHGQIPEAVKGVGLSNGQAPLHATVKYESLSGEAPTVPPIIEQTKNEAPAAEAQPLKIALIGTAPSSRLLAPFSDKSWTIWACSPGNMNALPRVDAWFEIHGNMLWPENRHYGEPYLEWLKKQTFPIYMQDKSFVPNAITLPIDNLVAEFGPYFFTSSFAWMMGLAMQQGAKEIALFGIDMASRDEYILQRPGAYYFFIEAKRRGIQISAPYESDIMQPPTLYGFSEVTPFGRKILSRKAELKSRLNEMRNQHASLEQNIKYIEGALEDLDYVESIWGGAQSHPYSTIRVRQG